MMRTGSIGTMARVLGAMLLLAVSAARADDWVAGQHYFVIQPTQPTNVPAGKVEVVEIFSYACPACNQFRPWAVALKKSLPANVVFSYVPASFRPDEDWPVFQRAYYTIDALGLVDKLHEPLFDAIWKSHELAVVDEVTGRVRNPMPTIEDVAKFVERSGGISAQKFLATARSFSVDSGMERADAYLKSCRVDSTPTLIVNGKYRVTSTSAGGSQKLVDLVKFLIARESGAQR